MFILTNSIAFQLLIKCKITFEFYGGVESPDRHFPYVFFKEKERKKDHISLSKRIQVFAHASFLGRYQQLFTSKLCNSLGSVSLSLYTVDMLNPITRVLGIRLRVSVPIFPA